MNARKHIDWYLHRSRPHHGGETLVKQPVRTLVPAPVSNDIFPVPSFIAPGTPVGCGCRIRRSRRLKLDR